MLVPSPPLPALTLPRRRHALPHVFRFNGCWSSFRSLLFAFRRFRSFPRSPRSWFPRTGHPLTLSPRSSSRCARLQLGLLWHPACRDITLCRQFAIPFSHRSECFFITLHCFRVSSRLPGSLPWGSRTCVSKSVEGKSRRRYIRTNILHPHPPLPSPLRHPHPTPPLFIPPILPTAPPTDCYPQGCGLLIYIAVCEQLLRS